jgi:hypothetical protein
VIRSRLSRCALVVMATALVAYSGGSTRAAPVPKHLMPKDEPVCFATRVGDRMVSNWNGKELVVVVTAVEKVADGIKVTQEFEEPTGNRHDQTVIVSAKGVQVVRYSGNDLNPPAWWLKLPHVAGNTWTDTWANQTRSYKTVEWEEVELPFGKVRAIRVERTDDARGGATTYWWAPGMGMVKWSSGNSGRELKSFTPGK